MAQIDDEDLLLFLGWKEEQRQQERKRGRYWLSPEGRRELKETFSCEDDSAVFPLLQEVERLEGVLKDASDDRTEILRQLDQTRADHDALDRALRREVARVRRLERIVTESTAVLANEIEWPRLSRGHGPDDVICEVLRILREEDR